MNMLAHQGGWDEILLVLAPVGLFALLLFLANRRAGPAPRRRVARRRRRATTAESRQWQPTSH